MALRTDPPLRITRGDTYVHRIDIEQDGDPLDLSIFTDVVVTLEYRRAVLATFALNDDLEADGIWSTTLDDLITAELDEGLGFTYVRGRLDGESITILVADTLIGAAGDGGDLTTLTLIDDATSIVLSTAGFPFPTGTGSGSGDVTQGELDDEIAARVAGDEALATDLTDEVEARGDADTALATAIDQEATDRATADGVIVTSVTNEATARAAADAAEATARAAADATKADLVGGVVPTAQLPAIAINDTFEVNSQAAMLALTAQKGDVAIRSDQGRTYILSTNSPATLADWKPLPVPTDLVLSVNGQIGAVVLGAADVGADPAGTAAAAAALRIPLTQRAAANGVATLDASTLIPDGLIPPGITRDAELGTAATANTGTTSGTVPLLGAGGVLAIGRLATGTPTGGKFVKDDGTLAVPWLQERLFALSSSATPTPNVDTTDIYILAQLATAAAFQVPAGSPGATQVLTLRIRDNGTAQALTWDAIYRPVGVPLPTTTVVGKLMYVELRYNATDTKWDVVSVRIENVAYETTAGVDVKIAAHAGATDPHGDRSYTDGKVTALVNGAPANGDTLGELHARLAVVEALGSLATDAELIAAVVALIGSADTAGDTLGELQSLIGLRLLKSANLGDVANAATALANLGGQTGHANLTALAGLTLVADRLAYADGTGTVALTTFTSLARTVLGRATAALMRGDLGAAGNEGNLRFVIDGGGSVITTGAKKAYLRVPYACTITGWTILADVSGSIVVDVWKDTYANYPPTVADTVTASAKPTLTTATKATSSTLTGWTTSVSAGDVLEVNVDSATTVTKVTLDLAVTRT